MSHPLHRLLLTAVLAAAVLATPAAAQQKAPLPAGTGAVAVPAGWTLVRGDALKAAARPDDPPEGPGRALLHRTLAEVAAPDAGEHLVLHAPGAAPGTLRLVDAYAAPGSATSAALQAADRVTAIRSTLEAEFAKAKTPATFVAADHPQYGALSGLALRFSVQAPEGPLQFTHHLVPAGEHVQYFDTLAPADDAAAPAAFASLLGSFDGARESDDHTLQNMLFGGFAGALLGIVMAKRRARRAAAAAAAGSDAAPR